jgi:hypothetical protein
VINRPTPNDVAVCIDNRGEARDARDIHLILLGNRATAQWSDRELGQQVTVCIE